MTVPGTVERLPWLSVALISAAALGYEVLLMRLFSIIQWHHFAYMIISLALLGYGASGTFIAIARRWLLPRFAPAYWCNLMLFGVSAVTCCLAAQRVAFNPEEILWDWHQSLRLLAVYLLLALPFFFAANGIALALTRYRLAVARIYAADLTGAGLGSLGIVLLLYLVFPDTAIKYLGALGALAALVAARELHRALRYWQLPALIGALLLLALPADWLTLQVSPYKELSQVLRISGTFIREQRSSPLGLISIVESTTVPLRHAPGLSLLAGEPIPDQLGLFTDADGLSAIDRNPQRRPLGYLDELTSVLPYYLATPQRVLILGAGGGSGIQQALNHDVTHIDAVEINPQVIELVGEEYADWSGELYTRPGVQVHAADARGFARHNRQRYDLIEISLLDAFGASSAGLHALNENYLYTVEALQDYLRLLAPGGYLAISRWIKVPPRDMLKLFATAVRALRENGVSSPGKRLILIRGWQTGTLLIKNGVVMPAEISALHGFCEARAFDTAWYPGMPASAANRFNRLSEPYFYQAATALTGNDAAAFTAHYKFNISPATDDKPYFSHFFQWKVLPEILALRGQGGLPLLESGYLVLVATLFQALVIGGVFILLPLLVFRRQPQDIPTDIRRSRVIGYFFAVGLAFLFIEIALLQKFILYLHHPLYAVATVLASFLFFAGLGSAWTTRLHTGPRPPAHHAAVASACIALLGGGYALLLGDVFDATMALPMAIRVMLTVLLIAPLAFCMGMPFPLGLARVGARLPAFVPWAWGINGCASVVSAILATLLAIQFGFTTVILAGGVLYLLAATMFP
ncbi:MAG: SAM-dependent methyltransferase [Gammaproteobacteria bacterium]|jgi:SAM-dependent methyltransferase